MIEILKKIWTNKYAFGAACFIIGSIIGILLLQTHIKETTTNATTKVEASSKASSNTIIKRHTVAVRGHGVSTTTTDEIIGKADNFSSNFNSNSTLDTHNLDITNPKYLDMYIKGGYNITNNNPLLGGGFLYNAVGNYLIGADYIHGFRVPNEMALINIGYRL